MTELVKILPALPPLNYENLNKRIGKLKDYPLKIPVAIIAIALIITTVIMVATIVMIGLVMYRLRGNLKILYPLVKILMGQATVTETRMIKQVFRTLLDLPTGSQLPPELPERRRSALTSERHVEFKEIPQKKETPTEAKRVLPSSMDIQRYEKYLDKRKEEIQKQKQ